MSEAREEAERRWPADGDLPDMLYPRVAVRDNMRGAFVAGAEWQASRPVTDAQVEAAAKALFEESQELGQDNSWSDPLPEEWRAEWLYQARAALEAAKEVLGANILNPDIADALGIKTGDNDD